MTAIDIGTKRTTITNPIILLTGLFVVLAVASVFLYSSIANLKHDVTTTNDEVARQEVRSAELENQLYAILDGSLDPSFIQSRGLVLDNNPRYIETAPAVSHSGF